MSLPVVQLSNSSYVNSKLARVNANTIKLWYACTHIGNKEKRVFEAQFQGNMSFKTTL
jgi:hypothetical protein